MALPHLASGDIQSVLPLGPRLAKTPSHTLFKSAQLEVLRIVLLAGQTMPGHTVRGEITVQCMEGCMQFIAGGQAHEMRAGDFLHLVGDTPHELHALEDSSALVTICLQPPPTR